MIGTTVLYKLAAYDAAQINARRDDARAYGQKHRSAGPIDAGDSGRTGHVEHTGNHVNEGDVFPAVVVADWSHGTPSGATSRVEGNEPGQWRRLP